MGHTIQQPIGIASLDTMGGLIAFSKPQDLPEGASPRTWDTDFEVGSVKSRPGLSSFFTYANTWQITGYSIGSGGLASFTYSGTPEPTTNEGITLSGFIGALSVLNGQVVYVEAVTLSTFMAVVVNGPILTVSGQYRSVHYNCHECAKGHCLDVDNLAVQYRERANESAKGYAFIGSRLGSSRICERRKATATYGVPSDLPRICIRKE